MSYKTIRNTALVFTLIPILAFAQDDAAESENQDELNDQYKARLASSAEREGNVRQQYMSMRISCMQQVCTLSETQQKKLELAAKGAVEKSLTKFQQQMREMLIQQQQLLARRQAGLRVAFAVKRPTMNYGGGAALKEKVWTTTVEQTLDSDQLKAWRDELSKQAAFERKLLIDLSLSMISAQVHLVSKQRDAFAPIIEKQLTEKILAPSSTNAYSKVSRDILPKLAQLPEAQIAKVLTESQLQAWKNYMGRFGVRNAAGAQAIGGLRAVPAQRLVRPKRLLPAE
jgi:hypothetical protein